MTSTSKGVAKLQKKGSSIGEVAKKNCGYGEGAKNPKKKPVDYAEGCGLRFAGSALERQYKSKNSWGRTYGEHRKYLEFSDAQFQGVLSSHIRLKSAYFEMKVRLQLAYTEKACMVWAG